jgi:hypothetical protein
MASKSAVESEDGLVEGLDEEGSESGLCTLLGAWLSWLEMDYALGVSETCWSERREVTGDDENKQRVK